ncbi:MAG TPA: ATP-binding protein [Thermoanaerobaculia bacterium]|jgi:chromosome segregation ATPase|nr:ATP-binding protein [Thermoanaerobaculia bacterium]
MFRLLELSLHGWDVWPPVRIPLGRDVVLLTGPNGSGKTTLLDAIRQLLNAPRLSSRRRLQNYLRRPDAPALIRAVVSNDSAGTRGTAGGGAPFRRERITTPEVTLACALVPAGGGAPEKRFAVLPGRPPLEDLRRLLLESRDWYGPDRYQRVLEGAGVTRSLMSVLAIEQGRTNALFELRPRELFRRVLEMLGDHAVLERYTEARRRFAESEAEVVRQTSSVQALELDLRQVERQVARLDDWEHHRDRVAELEARLPAAELQIHLLRRAEASAKLPELRTKVRRGDTELAILEAEAASTADRELQTETALDAARQGELAARSAWEAAHGRHVRAADRLATLEDRARQATELPAGDLDRLAATAETTARALFAAETAAAGATDAEAEARTRRDRLRAGLPVHPERVTRTLAALEAQGIESTLLAALVEVTDPDRGEAAEAALGDARWTLLVPEAAEPVTLEVARRHNFPGPVYTGYRLGGAETEGPLRLAAGAPSWLLHWPETVALHADGTWQDERGTWVASPRERVLGQAGREAALAAAEASLEEAARILVAARAEAEAGAPRRTAADAALATERRRRELLREAAALPAAREEAHAAAGALADAEAVRDAAVTAREDAHRAHEEALRQRLAAAVRVEQQTVRLRGEREALERTEADLTAADDRVRELADHVPADLYVRAEAGELDGPDTVATDLDRARQTLAGLGDPPPREVREEALHLRANIDEAERHLSARRREAGEAREELTACRVRYLEIVSGALQDYRRRATDLAGGAEVTVEMELPRLVDDDRVLDEATIEVRFGFDGKAPLPLGDPSFSGGQQVIAGLILLMAMAETDGRGFFILDEPFAHLSLDRVDQVGRFLRAARAQFILTAPTTLDRAQLDPASLVIVLQKKRPGEPHAPVPIVAEA